MTEDSCKYVIIGGGPAGASAVQGIREVDGSGPITLFGAEKHLPYNRSPLSKNLWLGKKNVEDIFIHPQRFYDEYGVTLNLGTRITGLWPDQRLILDEHGNRHTFETLLLATGGLPQKLSAQGGDLEALCYFRYLDDYLRMRAVAVAGTSVLVVGGGYIGSEIAAALNANDVSVTMIFPESYICRQVFPEDLARAVQAMYEEYGVVVIPDDIPASITQRADKLITITRKGNYIESDCAIVGAGITPDTTLAREAGLNVGDGILVDEYLETSAPGIYAAGDNAYFPYQALDRHTRVEHWDNALHQGRLAGRNMAGAREQYTHIPYFFSEMFEFCYEAVGDVNPRLEIVSDWQKEFDTGTIYYVENGKVRGVLMCNVPEKVEEARELIRRGDPVPERMLIA